MRLLPIIILLCSAPMMTGFAQGRVTATLSPDDRELVAAALRSAEWPAANSVIIESTAPICTSSVAVCISTDGWRADVIWDLPNGAQMRQALLARNQQAIEIGSSNLTRKAIRRAQIEQIFSRKGRGWSALRQMDPRIDSIIQVSAPAYSPNNRYAVIYVESICEGRCGGGALLLFERTSGGWAVSRRLMNWIG